MGTREFQDKIKGYAEQYRAWKKMGTAVSQVNEEVIPSDLTEAIYTFLNQEYDLYIKATQEECDAIRASFSINREFEDLLLGYVFDAAKELLLTRNVKWLERGLVAASLENSGRDYRDTYRSVDELYKTAKDVGIDPNPYFQKAASLASREKPRGGSTPLHVLLGNFASKPEKPSESELRETKNDPLSILMRLFKSGRK